MVQPEIQVIHARIPLVAHYRYYVEIGIGISPDHLIPDVICFPELVSDDADGLWLDLVAQIEMDHVVQRIQQASEAGERRIIRIRIVCVGVADLGSQLRRELGRKVN